MLACAEDGRLPGALTFDVGPLIAKTALAYLNSGCEYALGHAIAVFGPKL